MILEEAKWISTFVELGIIVLLGILLRAVEALSDILSHASLDIVLTGYIPFSLILIEDSILGSILTDNGDESLNILL